jgi:hypothetical protein
MWINYNPGFLAGTLESDCNHVIQSINPFDSQKKSENHDMKRGRE